MCFSAKNSSMQSVTQIRLIPLIFFLTISTNTKMSFLRMSIFRCSLLMHSFNWQDRNLIGHCMSFTFFIPIILLNQRLSKHLQLGDHVAFHYLKQCIEQKLTRRSVKKCIHTFLILKHFLQMNFLSFHGEAIFVRLKFSFVSYPILHRTSLVLL